MTNTAAAIVAELADRLRDPEAVIAATTANGEVIDIAELRCPPWDPSTLSRGPGALAVLFSELGEREVAHDYLQRTVAATRGVPSKVRSKGLVRWRPRRVWRRKNQGTTWACWSASTGG